MVDESAFDQGLRQAAERQSQDDDDSDRSRDVRPGRGTETGTTQPIDDAGSSGSSSSGGGGSSGGGSSGGGGGSSGGDSDRSVDRRPGRGTEDRTEPIDDDGGGSSGGDADRSDGDADMQQDMQQDDAPPSRDDGREDLAGGSVDSTPGESPGDDQTPPSDRSLGERIGDLQPGDVLRASGGAGRGDPDVEVVSRGENIRDVREARLLASTDLTRAELEGRQDFEEQQIRFELLGRLEAAVEEQVGPDVDIGPDDVRFTEEITETGGTRIGIELTEEFVEEDLPEQVFADTDRVSEPRYDPEPIEVGGFPIEQASIEAAQAITGFFSEEVGPETGAFAADLAEFVGFDPDEEFAEDIEDIAIGAGMLAAIPVGIPAAGASLGRAVTPGRLEARAERARELTFDVPTGEGITDFDAEAETREVTDSLAFGVPATVAQDVFVDPTRRLIAEEGTRGAGIQLGTSLVASAGLFSATAAISPRLGTATRFAIQPGEEVIGRAGFAATRRVFNERAAQRAFPNQEPLFASEEAVLRGLRRITPNDPGIVPAIRARELPPTPLQRARIRSLREESPAPPSTRSEIGTPEEELFEGVGGPRGRTELFEEPEAPERQPTGITEEQRRLATEITEREAATEGFVEIASPQEARLTQIRSPFELERTERIGAGLVPPVRVRRRTPDLSPADRGLFRDFRASELEARREQFRDFGRTETEFQDRIDEAERTFMPGETELEAEGEAEAELEPIRLRTEPAFFTAQAEAVEPIDAFEFKPPRLDLEFEQEIEQELEAEFEPPRLERVERPPEETEIDFPIRSPGPPGKPIFPTRTPGVTAPDVDLLGDEAIFEFEVPEL